MSSTLSSAPLTDDDDEFLSEYSASLAVVKPKILSTCKALSTTPARLEAREIPTCVPPCGRCVDLAAAVGSLRRLPRSRSPSGPRNRLSTGAASFPLSCMRPSPLGLTRNEIMDPPGVERTTSEFDALLDLVSAPFSTRAAAKDGALLGGFDGVAQTSAALVESDLPASSISAASSTRGA